MKSLYALLNAVAPFVFGIVIGGLGLLFFALVFGAISTERIADFFLNSPLSNGTVGPRIGLFALGCLCLVLAVLWIWSPVGGRGEAVLECPSEGGKVLIQHATAKEFVRKTAETVPGVMQAYPRKVWQRGGSTNVSVDILPDFNRPVHHIAKQVQEQVRRELENTLGLAGVKDVNVGILPPKGRGGAGRPRKSAVDDYVHGDSEGSAPV